MPLPPRRGLRRRALPVLLGVLCGGVFAASVVAGAAVARSTPTIVPVTVTVAAASPAEAAVATPTSPPPATETPVPAAAPAPTTAAPEPEPSPDPEPAPAPAEPPDTTATAAVVSLVNDQRAAAGCSPLASDDRLAAAAQGHADDMSAQGYFSHVSLDGRDFVARIVAAGYPSPGAENIAAGYPSAAAVMDGWMNSPGHRANILDCSLTTIGVGYAASGDYWVQDFGR